MNQQTVDGQPPQSKCLTAALGYRRQGLSVIPVQAAGKVPLISWAEYQQRIATEKEIVAWFQEWPEANVGIVTGKISGVTVVDLDGIEGTMSATRLNLYSPIVSLTGRGKHLWYTYALGVKNSAGTYKGIDIRGDGGFVVAAPSLSANQKRYCWAGSPISRGLLPPLPIQFIEQSKPLPGLLKRNEAGWIAEAIKEMQNGHVHNTLIRVLGKFRQHHFTEEDTYSLLCPHALENGKPYEGLRGKIAEFWQRYPAPSSIPGLVKAESVEDFLNEITPPEWMCEPFITKKAIGFVAGLPETLKTWLCMDFAVECTRGGGAWAGLYPVAPGKVWFIEQERTKNETQSRFDALISAKGITKNDLKGKLFINADTAIRLNLDSSFQAFRTALREMSPDVVIVDSFVAFHTVPENDKTEIQKVIERLKLLRDEVGCAFMFIHHENKNAYPSGEPQGEPNMSTISGSSAIPAAAEFCLIVRKVEEHTSMVWHVKGTSAKKKAKPFYASVIDTATGGVAVRGLND